MHDVHELLMSAPVLITVQRGMGMQLRLELINLYAREALGGRDLTGKTLKETFPELEPWLRKVDDFVLNRRAYVGVDEPFTFDWTGTGKTETRYLTVVCQPLMGLNGALDGSIFFGIDVTANVLARALSPHDRAWFENALDSIPAPIVLAEPGTQRILFSNAAARRLSHGDVPGGETFGQALGLDTGFFCTDAAGSRIVERDLPAARAARGEVVEAMDILWHTPFGVIPLVCFAESVPATQALPSVIVLSFFDVSRAKKLERDLLDSKALCDDFVSLVGHEVRTPLTALKLQTQSLLRQCPQAPGLAVIERATARMEAVADQMLDSARIRELGVHLEPEEMNLGSAVDEVIESFRAEAKRVSSPIERVLPVEIRGRWDRVRLKHVIANLLCNALRFGAGLPVIVETRDLGNRVSLVVSDGGIGIDPADHERIFERYRRVVSSRNFGGLGLGLWITRRIVLEMGGSIAVASEPGRGATFTVDLPKAPPHPPQNPRGPD